MTKDIQQQTLEQLQNLTIILLAQAGVTQKAIRDVVGVDANRVGRIAKHIKSNRDSKVNG